MNKTVNHAFRLKMAKQGAEAFLKKEGISTLPIDPFAIAASRNIEVKPKPDTAGGVSGMLLRHGDEFGILYATHVRSEGFQRFSVAHELGHFFLDGHIDHILPNEGIHTSHAGFVSGDPYELEADQFAAGLLMPSLPFKRALGKHEPGLRSVEALAELCKTSLTATAIRYAEITDDAVAVIISTGQFVDFCFMSDTMKSLPKLTWLKKGTRINPNTVTGKLASDSQAVTSGARLEKEIDISDWLGGIRPVSATEEVVGLGEYGKVLTVLTCPSLQEETYQDEDIDSDESLLESWTPRFRR